eukprot:jgi/Picre1/29150/NNA_004543.t1
MRERPDHALVRVSNVTDGQGVALYWIHHDGEERLYTRICPGQVYTQQTYVNHSWVVRLYPQGQVIGRFCAQDSYSTVSIYTNTLDMCVVEVTSHDALVPLHHIHSCLPSPRDEEWGQYTCRGATAHGIPICSFVHAVEYAAVEKSIEIIDRMLESVPLHMIDSMLCLGLEVAIIGCDQKTTDIPAHAHLRGEYIEPPSHATRSSTSSKRSFEHDTRGLGATVACPVLSCGEDNILGVVGKDRYPYESILVHEFAHAVMNLGLYNDTDLYCGIKDAYYAALRNNMYDPQSYVMANPEEYWAEMSQAWFHATKRDDVTSGIKTRDRLIEHDPRLAAIMARVYGYGSWRYYDDEDCHCVNKTQQHSRQNPNKNSRMTKDWQQCHACICPPGGGGIGGGSENFWRDDFGDDDEPKRRFDSISFILGLMVLGIPSFYFKSMRDRKKKEERGYDSDPIHALKRLVRELFEKDVDVRQRLSAVEERLGIIRDDEDAAPGMHASRVSSPHKESSGAHRNVDVQRSGSGLMRSVGGRLVLGGGLLWSGGDPDSTVDPLVETGMQLGTSLTLQTRGQFRQGKDFILADVDIDGSSEDQFNLQKVLYSFGLSPHVRLMFAPFGARGNDVTYTLNPFSGRGLTAGTSEGNPLIA